MQSPDGERSGPGRPPPPFPRLRVLLEDARGLCDPPRLSVWDGAWLLPQPPSPACRRPHPSSDPPVGHEAPRGLPEPRRWGCCGSLFWCWLRGAAPPAGGKRGKERRKPPRGRGGRERGFNPGFWSPRVGKGGGSEGGKVVGKLGFAVPSPPSGAACLACILACISGGDRRVSAGVLVPLRP